MTRHESCDLSEAIAEHPPSAAPRRSSAAETSLRRLEEYIRRDEHSLSRQRRILDDCDGPARAIALATVAEYEESLRALHRRRARLLARTGPQARS